jgi:hypothetical protein
MKNPIHISLPALTIALGLVLAAAIPVAAQTNTDDIAQLKQRVDALEKRVNAMSQLLEPLKAQQAADARRRVLHEEFVKRLARDNAKYTAAQLQEAEKMYQVANKQWGTPEAVDSLKAMIAQFPDLDRTGCAVLYLAQSAQGESRAKYLQDCITKFNDCYYGDGVQVGAYARYLLALDYRKQGDTPKAEALETDIKTQFPEAVDHDGNLLVESLGSSSNH